MKLLKQYFSSHQAELDSLKLENQGILTHVSSKHSHSLGGLVTGAFSVGLWIIFAHQFNDAKAFIADDSYEVQVGFSDEEIATLRSAFQKESVIILNRFISHALIGISTFGAVIASIIYYFW
tara:strand:- start:107 stop:472 length:366 start_codon:yes stop_codon:yes gene_type:complete